MSILHLLLEARFGRHNVLLRPTFARDLDSDKPSTQWLRSFDDDMRERLAKLLEASAELASRRSTDSPSITVIAGVESHWRRGELSLSDAASFLRQPLKLYLENKTSDWQFLLAMANSALRRELKQAAAKDWLTTEGGGLGELEKRVDELIAATEAGSHQSRLRSWVMFDRDADCDDPRNCSKDSDAVKQKCSSAALQGPWSFPHVQLGRRSIENYLPLEALRARYPYGERDTQIAAVERLRTAHPEAAFAYSMKEGIIKDASTVPGKERNDLYHKWRNPPEGLARDELLSADRLPILWQALPSSLRGELLFGFGNSIADEFGQAEAEGRWDDWFRREYDRGPVGQPRPDDVINQILELI